MTLLIAELGVNHNGSVDRALEMVRAAVESGAGAIKVQAFTPAEFVGPDATYTYKERHGDGFHRVTEKQIDLFTRCALSLEELIAIHKECCKLKVQFGATATDAGWVEELWDKVDWFKVGSDDITNLPLLRTIEATGKTTIISTGMATRDEIAEALNVWTDRSKVVLLHCVSLYPTPLDKVNLGRMFALRSEFGVTIGFSDHSEGVIAAGSAIMMGASVIEKHFTLDKTLPGPDHWFSGTPSEFKHLSDRSKVKALLYGSGKIDPSGDELAMRAVARRSIVAARDIATGETISESMLEYKRPGTGLPPAAAPAIVGQVAKVPIRKGDLMTWAALLHPAVTSGQVN